MRVLLTFVTVATLVIACGAEPIGEVQTSGAQCIAREAACHRDSECCSSWCVNGVCERREP